MVMVKTWKTYVGMLISVLLVVVSSAHADASFLLGGMHSEQVFEVTLLWNNGASYRQYAYVDEEQGICEIGASGEVGRCQIDLLPVAEAFKQIAVVEYIPRLPDSIHWGVEGEYARCGGCYLQRMGLRQPACVTMANSVFGDAGQ